METMMQSALDHGMDHDARKLMRRAMLALKQAWRALPDEQEELTSACDDLYREIQKTLGRDGEHCMCAACKDGKLHASCCAVHNEPALPIGPCDCDYDALRADAWPPEKERPSPMTKIPEDTDSAHQTAPVPSEVFTTRESLRERCDMFVRCLPQAPMRDRLARLFEELLADAWRPIESAPKDGVWLLLAGSNARTGCPWMVARWDGIYWESADDGYGTYLHPTHWMPLPAAPHHRSADTERHGSDKPESESEPESGFAALRAVPHQPTGARNA